MPVRSNAIIIMLYSDGDMMELGLTKRTLSVLSPYAHIIMDREGKYQNSFSILKRIIASSEVPISIPMLIPLEHWYFQVNSLWPDDLGIDMLMFKRYTNHRKEIDSTREFCSSRNIDMRLRHL